MSPNWISYSSRDTYPICGVATTLSILRSGWLVSRTGSSSKTSTAAMPGRPTFSASSNAPFSTNPERLVFTSSAVGFISARSPAFTMPRVASTRRMCSEMTSHCEKNACLDAAGA